MTSIIHLKHKGDSWKRGCVLIHLLMPVGKIYARCKLKDSFCGYHINQLSTLPSIGQFKGWIPLISSRRLNVGFGMDDYRIPVGIWSFGNVAHYEDRG